jgi:hypothetical protein
MRSSYSSKKILVALFVGALLTLSIGSAAAASTKSNPDLSSAVNPVLATNSPAAEVVINSTCAGWSVTVNYTDFAWGDVFVAGFLLPGMPSSDGFWNQATWVGSGQELGLSGKGPVSFIKIMVDINPLGPIDPAEFMSIPIGNIAGNNTIDDHPTVTTATLDTDTCPAVASSVSLSMPSTSQTVDSKIISGGPAPTSMPDTATGSNENSNPAVLILLSGLVLLVLGFGSFVVYRRKLYRKLG